MQLVLLKMPERILLFLRLLNDRIAFFCLRARRRSRKDMLWFAENTSRDDKTNRHFYLLAQDRRYAVLKKPETSYKIARRASLTGNSRNKTSQSCADGAS